MKCQKADQTISICTIDIPRLLDLDIEKCPSSIPSLLELEGGIGITNVTVYVYRAYVALFEINLS